MKIKKFNFWLIILIGALLFSGCYTQIKLEDDDFAYKKERKRVIIEKRVEKDGETEYERTDTTYESTDDYAYEEEERYYYPRHRRAYKFYHPGITIVVGGAVYYDPWYFDYFYYPYPYVVCRTYYLPWWYGYYRCYRVWHGFVYYDPFYNPFYAPPYWWYDPYWYGWHYPPIIQYRKNDYTRLRDQDGGRRGAAGTGNWGRDLNLQVASERSRLRDGGRGVEIDRATRPTSLDRERTTNQRDEMRTPTLRDRSGTRDRDIPTLRDRSGTRDRDANVKPQERTPEKRDGTINRDRRDERRQQIPQERGRIEDRSRDRNIDRNRENPEKKDTPPRRYDSNIPNHEQQILNERKADPNNLRRYDNNSSRNNDENLRINRRERIIIEYDVPRREYTPRHEQNNTGRTTNYDYAPKSDDGRRTITPRNESPRYEPRRNDSPRYEAPRYESPRHETPSRNSAPSYSPPSRSSTPSQTPAPINDRRRDQ